MSWMFPGGRFFFLRKASFLANYATTPSAEFAATVFCNILHLKANISKQVWQHTFSELERISNGVE